jgi:hypothetical protein
MFTLFAWYEKVYAIAVGFGKNVRNRGFPLRTILYKRGEAKNFYTPVFHALSLGGFVRNKKRNTRAIDAICALASTSYNSFKRKEE